MLQVLRKQQWTFLISWYTVWEASFPLISTVPHLLHFWLFSQPKMPVSHLISNTTYSKKLSSSVETKPLLSGKPIDLYPHLSLRTMPLSCHLTMPYIHCNKISVEIIIFKYLKGSLVKGGRLQAPLFHRGKRDWLEVHFASVKAYIKQTSYLFSLLAFNHYVQQADLKSIANLLPLPLFLSAGNTGVYHALFIRLPLNAGLGREAKWPYPKSFNRKLHWPEW